MYNKKTILIYFIFLHVVLIITIVKSNIIDSFLYNAGFVSNEISDHYKTMMIYHKSIDESSREGAVLFFGDSIIQGLAENLVHADAINFGIGKDTTQGLLNRLPSYKTVNTAKIIVVSIGVNDLARRSNNKILENYKLILNNIDRRVPVILTSILPIDNNVIKQVNYNERIINLNAGIKDIAKTSETVHYLDLYQYLVDDDKNLSFVYHVGDGMHLNKESYALIISLLKDKIVTILGRFNGRK